MSEVRKLGVDALEWGTGTTTSPGGKVVTKIHSGSIPHTLGAGVDVRLYGADPTGASDSQSAFVSAISAAYENGYGYVYVPRGTYRINSTIPITQRGVRIIGAMGERPGSSSAGSGSSLYFYGTGALFKLGADDGNGWNSGSYNGVQDFTMEHIHMKYVGGTTTSLSNGKGSYGTGTYGIQDWRGGDVRLRDCWIENFYVGFWGVQSDFDLLEHCEISYCKLGIYFGPRSDQFNLIGCKTLYNDTALCMERILGGWVRGCAFVDDGTSSLYPIVIGGDYFSQGAWDIGVRGVHFDGNWFESFGGSTTKLAFFGIGVGDTLQSQEIWIRNSTPMTNTTGNDYHMPYFAEIGNATSIQIDNLAYHYGANIAKIVHFVGTSDSNVSVKVMQDWGTRLYTDDSTGTCGIHYQYYSGSRLISSYAGDQRPRTFYFDYDNNAERSFFISSESDRVLTASFPNSAVWSSTNNGQNILRLQRKIQHGSAAPTTGTWEVGDIFINTGAGAVLLWKCDVAGTPGTWNAYP